MRCLHASLKYLDARKLAKTLLTGVDRVSFVLSLRRRPVHEEAVDQVRGWDHNVDVMYFLGL